MRHCDGKIEVSHKNKVIFHVEKNIYKISERFSVSLAHLNKLNLPYFVTVGKKTKIALLKKCMNQCWLHNLYPYV